MSEPELHCSHGVPRSQCPDPDSHHYWRDSQGRETDIPRTDEYETLIRSHHTIEDFAEPVTWVPVLDDEIEALQDVIADALADQLRRQSTTGALMFDNDRFELLVQIGNKLGMNL